MSIKSAWLRWLSLMAVALAALLCSCGAQSRSALFPVRGTTAVLTGLSRDAAHGSLDFSSVLNGSKPKRLEYRFESTPRIPPAASFEIEYAFSVPPAVEIREQYQLTLEAGEDSWALPMDAVFLGVDAGAGDVFHYAVPIAAFPRRFSLTLSQLEPGAKAVRRADGGGAPVLHIRSLSISERWFGFYTRATGDAAGAAPAAGNAAGNAAAAPPAPAASSSSAHFYISPFVYRSQNELVLDPPPQFRQNGGQLPELSVELSAGREAAVSAGNMRFEALPALERFTIPAGLVPSNAGPFAVSGDRVAAFRLGYAEPLSFPAPITADPGIILAWPLERWRDRRYELFRWEQFPSLLIFDFADYDMQDRFLKRLAFFTEKAGFRGRLAYDDEIADLHGWNAHDYRAVDLARFFEAARTASFPLLAEERELEQILLGARIIRRTLNGSIDGGEGGIVSVSRESPDYLRARFMAHEGFHGIFFIDEDFRRFSQSRWEQLPPQAKRFILSYFDYQHYDIQDEYLVINEFMSHILQQSVSQTGRYFGELLPVIIEASPWRQAVLPEKDTASNSWPALAAAFSREAEAFSGYVSRRWGLAGGRVRLVTMRLP